MENNKKALRKPAGYWTKDRVFEESKKYQTRSGFKKSCLGAYKVALKNAWLDEMDWLKEAKKPSGYWTKEKVFEESKEYQSRSAFSMGCSVAYNIACENKWLDEMIWPNEQHKPNGYWTKEKVFDESRKHQKKSEFSKGSNRAYKVARENAWLNEMVWLKEVRKPNGYWTKEKVFEESRKYQTRKKFDKGSSRAYEVARKNGWLDELFPKKKIKIQS